jgi:EAL domain-containing protein (putative c-di-GMP-specific phosphodiesterase class I)
VAQALQESGLEPGNLVIELTESTIMHNTEANLAWLQQPKALGVRIAIDDFGTGYSSPSYLHRFPIDILKIDRSFVSRLTNSATGPKLARRAHRYRRNTLTNRPDRMHRSGLPLRAGSLFAVRQKTA